MIVARLLFTHDQINSLKVRTTINLKITYSVQTGLRSHKIVFVGHLLSILYLLYPKVVDIGYVPFSALVDLQCTDPNLHLEYSSCVHVCVCVCVCVYKSFWGRTHNNMMMGFIPTASLSYKIYILE